MSLIMLDSDIRVSEKYSPQTLLEECKFEVKNTKMESFINNNLDLSSSMMKLRMNLIMWLNFIMMNNLLKFKT